jgi:hypothetical protein
MQKYTVPQLAAIVMGLVVLIFAITMAVMLVRGQEIPEKLWGGAAALGAYLVGWLRPAPSSATGGAS